MYAIEKITYQDQVNGNEESKRRWRETIEKYGGDVKLIRETGYTSEGNKAYRIHESVSDTPNAVEAGKSLSELQQLHEALEKNQEWLSERYGEAKDYLAKNVGKNYEELFGRKPNEVLGKKRGTP